MIFKVFRFNPEEDKKPYFKIYDVPVKKGMTVLDGLWYIQERLDGSLAFRSSCRAGVCGSCAMHINGCYRLACETQLSGLKGELSAAKPPADIIITIRPLSELKVIRDLVVDMEQFWKKYEYIKPYLMPGASMSGKERCQTYDERKKLDGLIECILCGCCS
ncbi:MAG: 2Fe-2S iron-sulfur cluster binding domain-containing protein, partial [Candidatus Omnitrophica bacterium]|nr:2Fe-2S iron-sulfur cluster binding domain-containing protein [Candidatus Omnitrophota bacterium]